MSQGRKRIAVLGAGVMGCSTALFLARRGMAVTLFDSAEAPFSAASRWNEGKIHLGFLYSGDPSLRTAAHVAASSLHFRPLVEELLDCRIDAAVTAGDEVYLCHRDSVVSVEAMGDYFRRVAALVREHPEAKSYLTNVSNCQTHRLTGVELSAITNSTAIVAGFHAPERSVSTTWIADRFVAAVAAENRIEARMETRVVEVRPEHAGDTEGRWRVVATGGDDEAFDVVINVLWQGRPAIDATAGLKPAGVWSNRYCLSLFARTVEPVDIPCVVIATGPFGDIKNYNDRDFYMSWYQDGLRVDSAALSPPDPPPLDELERSRLCNSILDHLQAIVPGVARTRSRIEHMSLEGGWVFAAGGGLLSDPRATLHRRSDFGITQLGSYFSVDTGKYAAAPWLAHRLADRLSS